MGIRAGLGILAALLIASCDDPAPPPTPPQVAPPNQEVRKGVTGRIVDSDGAPLAGAEIRVKTTDAKQEDVTRVSAAEDGRFAIADLKEGVYAIHVMIPSGQKNPVFTWQEAPDFFSFVRVKKAGEHVELGDLKFVRQGMELAGTVTDQNGAPVARARVFLANTDGYHRGPTITDDAGRYKLLDAQWNPLWKVTVLKVLVGGDLLFARECDDLEPWRTNTVDVTIGTDAVSVHGTVKLDGNAPKEAEVFVYQAGQKSELTFYPRAKVDADGNYRTVPLTRGAYNVVCRISGAPTVYQRKDLRDSAGETRVDFSTTGSAAACTGRIRVKMVGRQISGVSDPMMQPYMARAVYLLDGEGNPLMPFVPTAFLEDDGDSWTFRIPGLRPDRYGLALRSAVGAKNVSSSLEILRDRAEEPGSSFYMVHEPWRPLPADPLFDALVGGAEVHVEATKGAALSIDREFSIEDLRALVGHAAEQFAPE